MISPPMPASHIAMYLQKQKNSTVMGMPYPQHQQVCFKVQPASAVCTLCHDAICCWVNQEKSQTWSTAWQPPWCYKLLPLLHGMSKACYLLPGFLC